MHKPTELDEHATRRQRTGRGRFLVVFLGTLSGAIRMNHAAFAGDAGCTEKALSQYYVETLAPDIDPTTPSGFPLLPSFVPATDFDRLTQTFLDKIKACKGKLTPKEEAKALAQLLVVHKQTGFADSDACRQAAELGLNLDPEQAPEDTKRIAEGFGHCGGDCAKVGGKKMKEACLAGAGMRASESTAKLPLDFEAEQPVPCELGKARKLMAALDKSAFLDQALRFIAKYRSTCAKDLLPADVESLANDEALVHFHADNDAACLKALDAIAGSTKPGTAYNRALCGGPCTLDPTKCAAAAKARDKSVAGRALRAKLREKSQAFAWYCRPGRPCKPPARDQMACGAQPVLSWDLKTVRWVANGKVEREWWSRQGDAVELRQVSWKGDLNGDGLGDFVSVGGNREFFVYLGAGDGFFGLRFRDDGSRLSSELGGVRGDLYRMDDFVLRVFEKPGTAVRSACLFADGRSKCARAGCNDDPIKCADLTEWEQIEKAERR